MKVKKVRTKYQIEAEDFNLLTYEEVILEHGLLYKKNNYDVDSILKTHNFYEMYYKVLNFIKKRVRSEFEIDEFLEKNDVTDKEKIIKKLKNINLINDEMFCKAFIADKVNLSNDGYYKIYNELLKHNIDSLTITKYLDEYKEYLNEKLSRLILKKFNSSKKSLIITKQKITNEMINLGYDKEDISTNLNNLNKDDSELLKKEYDKLYKKLSSKYQGKELEYKIKERLYRLGFKYN